MKKENRADERFEDMGRVESPSLCQLPGVLEDISATGCRVHFPVTVEVDMEKDYFLKLKTSHHGIKPVIELLAHPQWVKEIDNQSEIGFKILRSPDTPELLSYIAHLKIDSEEPEQIEDMIIESKASFI